MKTYIKTAFNLAALTYGQVAHLQKKIAEQAARRIPKKNYKRILEIGCGNGQSSLALQHHLRPAHYLALDLAPAMVQQAQQSCPEIFFFSADGEKPPLRPHSFDLLFSTSCMQWYQEAKKSIPENLDLLKKNGYFSLSLFLEGTFCEIHECIKRTGYGSALEMNNKEYYIEIIEKKAQRYTIEEKKYILFFNSFHDFVKENRKSGTFATKNKKYGNKKKMTEFIETYNNLYTKNGKVQITYNTLFINGIV